MPINFIFNSTALLSSDSKAISYSGGHTGDAKHKEKLRSLGIGNLIALEIVLNNEAADKTYADKLDIYKKSKYNWLKEFFEGHPVWDFNGLDTRANDLAELYYTKILGRAKE